jgi:hypothetical protein
MKKHLFNLGRAWRGNLAPALALGASLLISPAVLAEPPRVLELTPGGVSPLPFMYGHTNGPGGVMIAPSAGFGGGPFQAVVSTNLKGPWLPVGPQFATNYFTLAFTNIAPICFYRVRGPDPAYNGAISCGNCHGFDGVANAWVYDTWKNTKHAHAYDNLPPFARTNASCLPCHTVGFGFPNGYTANGNPMLRGVQCENCHGPGGAHARNRSNPAKYPAIELTAKVCGGCHSGAHNPAYEEWETSGHARLDPELVAPFTAGDTNRMNSCGPCHGAAVRMALLKRQPLPKGAEANQGVVCVTCHEPHGDSTNTASLRNPLFSTNDYTYFTAGAFSTQYNAAIQICGQCHNDRGAVWTTTSRPPHHSPQYNMLLGSVGELVSGQSPYYPAAHATMITNQCVGCHMQTSPYVSDIQPAVTGHNFAVTTYASCLQCHPLPEGLVHFTTGAISNQIQQVQQALNYWALNQAPPALRTKYGTRAWEFTTPGSLSTGGTGPTTAEQTQIPANIKKARFNLYLVLHDGSFGVHNAPFAVGLLDAAMNFVQAELNN